jgi:hypothetical protein
MNPDIVTETRKDDGDDEGKADDNYRFMPVPFDLSSRLAVSMQEGSLDTKSHSGDGLESGSRLGAAARWGRIAAAAPWLVDNVGVPSPVL